MIWLAVVGLALGLAGAGVIVVAGSGSIRPASDLSPAEAEATYAACQGFVRPRLQTSGPVTFAPIRRRTVRHYGDGRAYVRAHADAPDAAGRVVEMRFTCTLRPLEGGRWELEGLTVSTD